MRVYRIFPAVRISSSFFRALRNVSAMGTTRPPATSASPRPPRKRQGRAGALVLFDRWPDVPPRAGRMWDGCLACQTPPFSCHRHCTQNYRRGQARVARKVKPFPGSWRAAGFCSRDGRASVRTAVSGGVKRVGPHYGRGIRRQFIRRKLTAKQGRARRRAEQGMRS